MEKNWLIRTKAKQILGPVSKAKVVELIQKGSIKGEDEIASGNGYWFQIKEKDLVEKYVYADAVQSFNPISEAPDVLTGESSNAPVVEVKKNVEDLDSENTLPQADDLEYPDMGESAVDHTVAMKLPTKELLENDGPETSSDFKGKTPVDENLDYPDEANPLGPDDSDLEYPDMGESEESLIPDEDDLGYPDMDSSVHSTEKVSDIEDNFPDQEEQEDEDKEVVAKKKTSKKKKSKSKKKRSKKKKEMVRQTGNDRYLFIILGLLIAIMGGLFFYYKKIINKPLPFIGMIISNASAQTTTLQFPKKKT